MDSSVIHAKALNKYIYTVRFTLTYFFFFFSLPYILPHASPIMNCNHSFLYKWNVPNEAFDPQEEWGGPLPCSSPFQPTSFHHLRPETVHELIHVVHCTLPCTCLCWVFLEWKTLSQDLRKNYYSDVSR